MARGRVRSIAYSLLALGASIAGAVACNLGPLPCEPPPRVPLPDGRFVAIEGRGGASVGEERHPQDDARDLAVEIDRANRRVVVTFATADGRRIVETYRMGAERWLTDALR